ncbi:cyclic nucleotide-binding domain-containing protein [Alloalcanivorax sp. C16-2]|uniref:cyclic nucleotide-binding domain-containing protein n=1 Tax=Alloalcanivorax TaxID=3020832 RepID=UPI0019346165|nr:cyclic nucleotide-binding domain-containing protein [Alloalcanivorax marinus]MBL7250168.1 cyclic nucleotide-binding domain-containing protein [Alloalcanivorax marinus]
MKHASWQDSDHHRVEALLAGVPFFNEVARDDADQRARLLARTEIIEAGPGDTVIRAGEVPSSLYFLLRGQLVVLGDEDSPTVLYYVSPGEVFGTLSMLLGRTRGATIRVADAAREAVLARLDFKDFDDDRDTPYSLATRLAFFHMLVHQIRWAVEVRRMQSPDQALAAGLRKVPVFSGQRDSEAELVSLREQARALADLLYRWNHCPPGTTGNAQLT